MNIRDGVQIVFYPESFDIIALSHCFGIKLVASCYIKIAVTLPVLRLFVYVPEGFIEVVKALVTKGWPLRIRILYRPWAGPVRNDD